MTFGVKDLSKRFAVGEHTVLAWIRSGDLRAINVGRKNGGRPKWRVTEQALADFEQLRAPDPPLPRARRRANRMPDDFIEFYK